MLVYVLRRLLVTIPVLIAATFFTFVLVDASGDPLQELRFAVPPVPEETIQARAEQLYLDRPTIERYWLWLTGVGNSRGDIGILQGKWGPSTQGAMDIGQEISERFLITLRLVAAATLFALGLAVVTGVISAVKQYSLTDNVLTFFGFLGLAMPTFWLAALVKEAGIWANQNLGTNFATLGATSPLYYRMEGWEAFMDVVLHLVLPTLTLMLTGYAAISRYQRASMLEVLNSDYIRLARAKGLRNRVVMRRHALRTALIPVVTLAALTVSAALTGAVITETVFRWRGLGTFLTQSIAQYDAFAVMAFLVISGVLVVGANLIADLLYGVLDPRIRYD
ncbi:MAG: ABC transporter permease [Acidimicrobiales bacterium]|nr:ABC transporter permease [Acidimicrobiales bacterium]